MSAMPLLAMGVSDCIAWCGGKPVSRGELLRDAHELAKQLPDAQYVLNLCRDRYSFLTGFAAACLRGKISLLPSSDAPATIVQISHAYSDHHVLDDLHVNRARVVSHAGQPQPSSSWPSIEGDRCVAIVFTSGTTGAPQPHPKTWRELCATGRAVADQFAPRLNLVATVPAQHMYGLEATIALTCASGCSFHDGRPFFPQDIRAALASIPAPRALVTTPAHLRVCLESEVRFEPLEMILCATAPLESRLAAEAEAMWNTALHEIYGSTEAGVMATRRTTAGEEWNLLPGASLRTVGDSYVYSAPQLATPVELHDLIEPTGRNQFVLRGRSADLIKVAGKRASLTDITARLRKIPGVEDCVVFQPDPQGRPAALVVAAGLESRAIAAALAGVLEPSFVPRPLVVVQQLPRNAVGKFDRAALLAAIRSHDE